MSVSKWWHSCWLLSSLTLAIVGCAQVHPADQGVAASSALDQLQANLAKQFPDARPVRSAERETPLPRALDVIASGQAAYAAAAQDFEAWCKHSSGVQYGPIWPNETPNRANVNTTAIKLMYSAAAADVTSDFKATTCVLAGRSYALASGAGAGRRRVIAWFGPDDAAAFIPAARAEQGEARRLRKAEEERLAQEKVTRFLSDSLIGTQTSCVADQLYVQTPAELTYRCGAYLIPFAEFNRFGWRITSQSVAPQGTGTLNATSRVTLLVEKVR